LQDLDLVHPYLFPLVSGISRIIPVQAGEFLGSAGADIGKCLLPYFLWELHRVVVHLSLSNQKLA
jgi:hypothetical protein